MDTIIIIIIINTNFWRRANIKIDNSFAGISAFDGFNDSRTHSRSSTTAYWSEQDDSL